MIANYAINSKLQNYRNNGDYHHRLYDKIVFAKIRDGLFGGRVRFFITGAAPLSKDVLDFF